jgi:hypothetical protein
MKGKQNVPTLIYVPGLLLAMVYYIVFLRSGMDSFTVTLYSLLLPLTGAPYILWVVKKEGQEPEKYFKDTYAGRAGWMWVVRGFMMVIVSVLSLFAAIVIFGAFGLLFNLFK